MPIIVRDKDYAKHPCKDALEAWGKSPIVKLKSWSAVYPTMERLLNDPTGLDERQYRVRLWYEHYMKEAIAKFELFILS